jgi:hypothetical protein
MEENLLAKYAPACGRSTLRALLKQLGKTKNSNLDTRGGGQSKRHLFHDWVADEDRIIEMIRAP